MSIFDELADTDLDAVDTSYPNLEPGQWEFEVKEATKEDSKSGGEYLLFLLGLVSDDARDTNGNPLNPGYSLRHMINLTPSAKQIEKNGEEGAIENVKKDICKFLDAVGASRKFDPTLESYKGLRLFAKTRISKERTDPNTGVVYGEAAEIASLIPQK